MCYGGFASLQVAIELSQIEQIWQKNIAANDEVLKELALPICNWKFDRHVSNISNEKPCNSIIGEDESPSDSEYAEHTDNKLKELVTGEEVYLVEDGKEIFRARYEETNEELLVHGIPVQPRESRVFIIKVMRNVIKWKNFNSDIICQGSAFLWSKDELIRSPAAISIN